MSEHKRQSKADFDKGQTQRRKVLSLCHELGWTYPTYGGKIVVDFNHLDKWMIKYSCLHKPLNYYTPSELPQLVTQFENMTAKELAGRDHNEVIENRINEVLDHAKHTIEH